MNRVTSIENKRDIQYFTLKSTVRVLPIEILQKIFICIQSLHLFLLEYLLKALYANGIDQVLDQQITIVAS